MSPSTLMSITSGFISCLYLAGAAIVVCALKMLGESIFLPPGPKGLPFIGNTLNWPKEKAWETFTKWGQIYGSITYVSLFGQRAMILNDPALATELLGAHSDRPTLYMAGELAGYKNGLTLMQYGEPMRQSRAMITRSIGSKTSLAAYTDAQEAEIDRCIRRVIENSDQLPAHLRKLASAIILNIVYGYQVQDGKDEMVDIATMAMDDFAAASVPGQYLVDIFPYLDPVLRWIPGLKYRNIAAKMKKTQVEFLNRPYEYVEDQIRASTARASIVGSLITAKDAEGMTPEYEHGIKWSAVTMFGGGSDTTVSSFLTFFLAMTLHPNVQRRAQEEIDAVLGPGSLPRLADRSRLPFVEAVFLEVLRWGQVVPQGVAHVAQNDCVHGGFYIPTGTILIPNIWYFTHDPDTHPDPMSFNPARFLKTDEHEPESDPRQHIFGYGRRVCPGRHLAEQSIWLLCAASLAALSISKATSEDGHPAEPDVEYIGHLITHPKDFPCIITARIP